MSKHFHSAMTYEIDRLVKDIQDTPIDDWEIEFGIESKEDGRVLDIVENVIYGTLYEWAKVQIELDYADSGFEHSNKRQYFDDEY